MNQGNLVEKVLKSIYYPNSSFLEAELGSCPGYSWREIWEARWVLKRGLRWRVGNGESIRVWDDAWVPSSHGFRALIELSLLLARPILPLRLML